MPKRQTMDKTSSRSLTASMKVGYLMEKRYNSIFSCMHKITYNLETQITYNKPVFIRGGQIVLQLENYVISYLSLTI